MRELRRHAFYYISLLLIEVIGFILIISANGQKSLQMTYVVLLAGVYIVWGLVHHKLHHDLQSKIVLEYVLMGSLGVTILFFLLH